MLSSHWRRQTGLVRGAGRTTAQLMAELRQDASVERVEPNYLRWATGAPPTNDTLFAQMWALRNTGQTVNGAPGTAGADIRFINAWNLAGPATGQVVVAVMDTGVDYTHPDLVSNIWSNAGEISSNSVDDDGNGYVDDIHGYDFAGHVADPVDSGLHGTHVSGTIAATGGNQQGVIGVNFQARIMALKASSDGNTFTDAAVIEAIQYATMMKQRGVNIVAINASLGGGGFSATESAAIQAAGDAGIVFCAAAGNDSANNDVAPVYPASYRLPNMIVVAASDSNDALAGFSNFGATTVDLAAPGVNILSTIPVNQGGTTASVQRATVTYAASGLTYAGTTTGITANVYYCGLGNPGDFPAAVSNNIALIARGTLLFTNKVSNAMAAGAKAAIIFNNVAGNFQGTLITLTNWIPAVSISQADGQALQALLPTVVTVVNVPDPTQIYQFMEGTSMASPHVAGAVAFAAMNFPQETNVAQRIQRILRNVDAVPGLQGLVATGGRLNLEHVITGTATPVFSNAVAEVDGITVVLPNQTTPFAPTGTYANPASCLWDFGDGATSTDCEPAHVYTGCGPETVTTVASDGVTPVTNSFVLAVACPFATTPKPLSLKISVPFATNKLASASLAGVIGLPVGYDFAKATVQLDVGSVAVPFTLDAKRRGVNSRSTLKLQRKGKPASSTQLWQVRAKLQGDWTAAWAVDGLASIQTNKMPVTIPVLLFVHGAAPEAFYTDKSLLYTAQPGKSGAAK
jgi:subtilisin family serine protease